MKDKQTLGSFIKEKRILWDIIIKFSVNPATVYSSFQEIIEKEEFEVF